MIHSKIPLYFTDIDSREYLWNYNNCGSYKRYFGKRLETEHRNSSVKINGLKIALQRNAIKLGRYGEQHSVLLLRRVPFEQIFNQFIKWSFLIRMIILLTSNQLCFKSFFQVSSGFRDEKSYFGIGFLTRSTIVQVYLMKAAVPFFLDSLYRDISGNRFFYYAQLY